MTDKKKLEAIRAEIERFRKTNKVSEDKEYAQYELDVKCGYDMALDDMLSYINSLSEETVSEELEEATTSYADNHYMDFAEHGNEDYWKTYYAFKAGAKWQKDKMMQNTIDAQCFGFQGDALFSFRLPADNYLVGSEVKVIVIKKDEL